MDTKRGTGRQIRKMSGIAADHDHGGQDGDRQGRNSHGNRLGGRRIAGNSAWFHIRVAARL